MVFNASLDGLRKEVSKEGVKGGLGLIAEKVSVDG